MKEVKPVVKPNLGGEDGHGRGTSKSIVCVLVDLLRPRRCIGYMGKGGP